MPETSVGIEPSHWVSYNDLAWTELILSPPESAREEAEIYCRIIQEHAAAPVETLLHLGSGAGILDHSFKRYFEVTVVDISPGMLEVARGLNPEVTYHEGDMRSVNLSRTFDAVAIPDSIGYMTTEKDLHMTLHTAAGHLRPGGALVYLIRESGALEVVIDRHTIGVFCRAVWRRLFEGLRLRAEELRLDHLYDAYLLGEGGYHMTVFLCRKRG